jgi:hypothetical protein
MKKKKNKKMMIMMAMAMAMAMRMILMVVVVMTTKTWFCVMMMTWLGVSHVTRTSRRRFHFNLNVMCVPTYLSLFGKYGGQENLVFYW